MSQPSSKSSSGSKYRGLSEKTIRKILCKYNAEGLLDGTLAWDAVPLPVQDAIIQEFMRYYDGKGNGKYLCRACNCGSVKHIGAGGRCKAIPNTQPIDRDRWRNLCCTQAIEEGAVIKQISEAIAQRKAGTYIRPTYKMLPRPGRVVKKEEPEDSVDIAIDVAPAPTNTAAAAAVSSNDVKAEPKEDEVPLKRRGRKASSSRENPAAPVDTEAIAKEVMKAMASHLATAFTELERQNAQLKSQTVELERRNAEQIGALAEAVKYLGAARTEAPPAQPAAVRVAAAAASPLTNGAVFRATYPNVAALTGVASNQCAQARPAAIAH